MRSLKIAINVDGGTLKQLNRLPGREFCPVGADGIDAVVVVRDAPGFDLESAVNFNCPVVVVAGSLDGDGKKIADRAKELFIPDECVVVKDGDEVRTLGGSRLARSAAGIGIRAVLAAVDLAVERGLVPDVLLWREPPDVPVWRSPIAAGKGEASAATNVIPTKTEEPRAEGAARTPRSYQEFVDLYEYVLCLALGRNAGADVKTIAEALGAVHVECGVPKAGELYGSSYESNPAYAYEAYGSLMLPGGNTKAVVQAAMEDLSIDVLELLYSKARAVVHAAATDKISAVRDWLDAGYKLAAVITDDVEVCSTVLGGRVPAVPSGKDAVPFLAGVFAR